MRRIITVKLTNADGSEQEQRHESNDSPVALAAFITGITDDNPNSDITFTVRSERESHDPPRERSS